MSQVMEHVQQLADTIGPRPAATDAEARAADYIEEVFRTHGLDVERQEFDTPRTTAWAFVLYHLLTIGAAILSLWLGWVALVVASIAAVLLLLDLGSRFSLARFLSTGPSQNVIARHVPRQRRGERLRRVVIIAHYDSAKPSLMTSPGLSRHARAFLGLTKASTIATPVVIAVGLLPADALHPWVGYVALAAAAYLLFPIVVHLHQQLFMHAVDGANDNASGVAAMLAVLETTVPEGEEPVAHTRPRMHGQAAAYESGVVPDDALLEYRDVAAGTGPSEADTPLGGFGDIDWETGRMEPVRSAPTPAPAPEPLPAPDTGAPTTESDDWTGDAGTLWDEPTDSSGEPAAQSWRERRPAPSRPAPSSVPANWGMRQAPDLSEDESDESQGRLDLNLETQAPEPGETPDAADHEGHGISAWLGIGRGFDVRKAGKKIGSWDNLDHDDDEFGFKAGTAGDLPDDTDVMTAEMAARIRRRVTESVDRALVEKEIWFVATGADEVGQSGTRALLEEYADDLSDALIINIAAVGIGTVNFITDEGVSRSMHADRRLIAQAKRTARENELPVKGRSLRGDATSITPALARKFKAMSVMAFDINGRVPNRHRHTDTVENVHAATIEQASAFVTALLRDL